MSSTTRRFALRPPTPTFMRADGPGVQRNQQRRLCLIALFGGLLALTGRLDIGTFFTFLSYAKQFTQPINQIANQMNTIFSALAGAERVFEMMDTASEEDQAP